MSFLPHAGIPAGRIPLGEEYALEISDRFEKEDRFSGPKFAMRHYVRPVRGKIGFIQPIT